MPEIGTSGFMSGGGKRACWLRALPRLYPSTRGASTMQTALDAIDLVWCASGVAPTADIRSAELEKQLAATAAA